MTRMERVAAGPGISRSRILATGRSWFAGLMMPLCLASVSHAQPTYRVVAGFDRPFVNGALPSAGVIQASDGSFYGTTSQGGAADFGTIFKLDAAGTLTTLHSFTGGGDGAYPYTGLMQAADGSFYGTTTYGGTAGAGTVFKLDEAGTLTTLHSFTGGGDGAHPGAELIQATDGNFYGTTSQGGASAGGTVFKIHEAGTLTTLYSFTGGSDGGNPSRVIQATDGNFYGTSQGGASGAGTVFKLDRAGTLTTLYSFTGGNDGWAPSGVIQATDGSFYGTTVFGYGTVFNLDGSGTLRTIYRFTGGKDGAHPVWGVIQATDGDFYGTTSRIGDDEDRIGTVFKLDGAGRLTTLHTFTGDSDGWFPHGGVIQATDGSFYGTTSPWGASGASGTVFKLDGPGNLTTLYTFTGGTDGDTPYAGVIQATDGSFYGTTLHGGASGGGTVFKIDGAGALTRLHSFTGGREGAHPSAGLIEATDGSFYGTTSQGGASGAGTVFNLDTAGTLQTLHSFTGGSDGAYPSAGVIEATDGSFYGTTCQGGPSGGGTVFKLHAAGTLTTLYSFTGGTDGGCPTAALIQASDGSLYGTTYSWGASGGGTVFKFDEAGTLTTLYSFAGGDDGAYPHAGLVQATDGIFYGTTSQGGKSGGGTVFKFHAAGMLTTLYSFTGGTDGGYPTAGVIQASDGSFYGTTLYGGASGAGTVFKLDGAGTLTTLHSFAGGTGGAYPNAGLIQAADGSFYGTTFRGGPTGGGTVWTLKPVSLRVETPNTPVRWGVNTRQRLAWSYRGAAAQFQIDISRDGGDSWALLAVVSDRPGSSQSFYWTVTGPSTPFARLRVTAIGDENATDVNDADIRIADAFIAFILPSRRTVAELGTSERIFFKHNLGARTLVAVDVSDDEGETWRTVADETLTTGSTTSSYSWVVDGMPTPHARMRIRALDGSGATAHSPLFSIVAGRAPHTGLQEERRDLDGTRGVITSPAAINDGGYGP